MMPLPDPSPQGDIFYNFLSIALEGGPYILLGTIISGFIDAYLPAGMLDRLLPRRRGLAIFASGLLGAVFPVCECAIVPVIRRLVRKGLPVSCAITYMLSAPIINPIVIFSTLSAFAGKTVPVTGAGGAVVGETDLAPLMTGSRLLMAYMVTVLVGFIVQRFRPEQIVKRRVLAGLPAAGSTPGAEQLVDERGHDHAALPGRQKLVLAMRTAMRDFLDTAMYFTIGVLITSVLTTQFPQGRLAEFTGNALIGVPVMMLLAFVLSLCSTSDAFIVAPFQPDAIPNVAKLAFLVFGPMMDVKLVFMYAAVFQPRFVIALLVGLAALIGLLCIPWSFVF